MRALALNAGSSSIKAALYDVEADARLAEPPAPVWEGGLDRAPDDAAALLDGVPGGVEVVGHRVVHGGERFRDPVALTDDVKAHIAELAESAPLHNAAALAGIEAAQTAFGPGVAQVAVFDTAFHARLPAAAYTYAGPYEWLVDGLRRFGFHGINHEYVAHRAAHDLGRDVEDLRLITLHLGSGCSLAAIRGGRSVDTTMGFTPLEGTAMATRSGSIDPGLLLHLLRAGGVSPDDLDHTLNQRSGLAGLAGGTGDLREVLEARDGGDRRAALAFDVYVHRLRRSFGEMLASLGGLDAAVFTGGVGEGSAEVRDAVVEPFAFLGMETLVVPAREDWSIARSAARVVALVA